MQLIKIKNEENSWYWHIDYRFENDESGIYADSITYNSDTEAYKALINNKIEWDYKPTL